MVQWLNRRAFACCLPIIQLCLISASSFPARGESATTRPDIPQTPQEALAQMNDGRFAQLTPDQAIDYYAVNNGAEKKLALLMAESAIENAKLEQAVKKKWGDETATTVSHVIADDTHEDDAQAAWTINGDHAVAQFKADGISPIILIRIQGRWKIDTEAYVIGLGNQLRDGIRFMQQSGVVVKNANEAILKQPFGSGEAFIQYLKKELDKIDPPK